jgi:hypothetical protein
MLGIKLTGVYLLLVGIEALVPNFPHTGALMPVLALLSGILLLVGV